jgi:hypothetical protein
MGALKKVLGSSMKMFTTSETLKEGVERIAGEGTNNQKYIIAVDIQPSSLTILYSSAHNHALPLAINIAANTELLRRLSTSTPIPHISNINDPFEKQHGAQLRSYFNLLGLTRLALPIGMIFVTLFPLGLALSVAGYIVGPVEERICQVRFTKTDL